MKTLFIIGIALLLNSALYAQGYDANYETTGGVGWYVIEKSPEFPGGEDSLRTFIARNVVYPKQAIEKKIEGRVYVRFCINYKGFVEQASVIRGIHPLLDRAALDVVKKLPRWKPGKDKGKRVNVWYTVPVNFKLPENSKK